MGEKKKTSAVYARLVKFMSIRSVRITCVGIALLLSLMMMFLLDSYNSVRNKYLSFLNDNFFDDLLEFLNLEQFNAMQNAWIIFLGGFITILAFVIAAYAEKAFVDSHVKKNDELFKKKRMAQILFKIEYYLIVAAVCAALIFVFYMLGVFDKTKGSDSEVYLNLLYISLLCLMFVVLIPLLVIIIFFILHLILKFFGWFAFAVSQFKRDVEAATELEHELHKRKVNVSADISGSIPGGSGHVLSDKKDGVIFPSLMLIDQQYAKKDNEVEPEQKNQESVEYVYGAPVSTANVTLESLALRFQAFAASKKIYYELSTIRAFIAGFATSRLIILQGVSGTGKSTMPRLFGEFVKSSASFSSVQATWRDKTDLLGYYSEFSQQFKSTDFLKDLYEASYKENINLMVLDEMNISRMEYYFADFISVMELPIDSWNIRIVEPDEKTILPANLENGYLKIPTNTWMIGTANTDDSTYTITDKVYDRATVLTFDDKFTPFVCERKGEPIDIDAETLMKLFEVAGKDDDKRLSKNDMNKFLKICNYVNNTFDVYFGNRIMVQIENFVPAYVALGGTKEEALDFMFAGKILRKLDNPFDDYLKENLVGLLKTIESTYGKGTFKETEKIIAKKLKRLV